MEYALYIFDADGTLCATHMPDHLLLGVEAKIAGLGDVKKAIASNQGSVGMKYWMESQGFGDPSKYRTQREIEEGYGALASQIGAELFIAFAYQSKSSGKWGPVPDTATPAEVAAFADCDKHPQSMLSGNDDPRWRQDWRKPAPGMLLAAMQWAGVDPERTLFVGDEPTDQQAAEAAGCSFAWAKDFFGWE